MDPTLGQDHYAVLGVPEDATAAQIQAAYEYRLRLSHPDLYPGDPQVQRWVASLDAARGTLIDPGRRAAYDRQRAARRFAPAVAHGPAPSDGARPDPTEPPAPTQQGKVVLSADQARDGCAVQWVQDAAGTAGIRTLAIPPGVAAGAILEFPAEVVDGVAFPALRLGIVIESGAPEAAGPSLVSFHETQVQRRRSPLPLGIAAAAVLALAMVLGVVLGVGRGGPAPVAQDEDVVATPAPSPAATPAPSPSAARPAVANADQRLADEVVASKAAVRALDAGGWVPQVSSLCAGPQQADLVGPNDRMGYPDGRPERYASLTEADILAFHQAIDARFDGAAVLVDGTPTAVCRTPARWVSLLSIAQPSADGVAQWCSAQQLPSGSCVATQITAEQIEAARYVRHRITASGGTATMDVPWFMRGKDGTGSARFTDPDSGAVVRIRATAPGAAASMAEAEDELDSPATAPVLARAEPNGFSLSGFTASGDIYYWRQYAGGGATVDVVWTYPVQTRETFDAAVVRGVRTFQTTG